MASTRTARLSGKPMRPSMMPVTMDTLNEESIVQEASEQRDRQASPLVDTKQRKEGGKMERKDRDDKEKEKERERRREKEKEKEKEKKKRDDKDPKMSALNAQLVATGYTTRGIKLEGLSNADQERVSNVLTGLLDGSSAKVTALEDTTARIRTLEYERDRLEKFLYTKDREVARIETDMQVAKAQAVRAEERAREEEGKTRALKDDVARGRKALDNLKVAAGQESKRFQIKHDKVLAQLARQVPFVPPTFELMNPIAPGDAAPSAARDAGGPIPLFEASLNDLAELRKSLQVEIDAFRHVAVSTANALRDALAAGTGEDPPARFSADDFFAATTTSKSVRQLSSWKAHPTIADARLRALVADVRAQLTAGVSPVMRDGSGETEEQAEMAEEARRAERLREREMADLRDRVKDLEVELQIAAAKNDEANKVVEQMAKLSVQGGVPSTTDFADARLREELVRQKRQLDDERTTLRDRDMRLTEDRMLLDAELAAFAADRDAAIAAAVATALAATEEAKASTAAQNSPPSSPKHRHRPVSPSPMSPLRRTPGKSHAHQHVAVRRRVAPRTPLSRLVLERATLDRDRRKVSGSSLGEGNLSAKFAASRTGPPSAPGSAAPAPLGASARENVDVFAEPSQEGKARDDPKIRTSLGDKEVRKSSLHASTAASAARAKSDKVLSNGARSGAALAGHPLAKGSTARAWR